MTGTEFGVACGVIGSVAGAVFGGMATLLRERNKGKESEGKLALEHDKQEHQQVEESERPWKEAFLEAQRFQRDQQQEINRLIRRDGAHEESLKFLDKARQDCDADRNMLRARVRLLEQSQGKIMPEHPAAYADPHSTSAIPPEVTAEIQARDKELRESRVRPPETVETFFKDVPQ